MVFYSLFTFEPEDFLKLEWKVDLDVEIAKKQVSPMKYDRFILFFFSIFFFGFKVVFVDSIGWYVIDGS